MCKQAHAIMYVLRSTPDAEDNLIVILKTVAKKSGLFVARKTNIQLLVS